MKIIFFILSIIFFAYAGFSQKAIDLGLSVKWAMCNVGATKPEECGNHYAWGETETKEIYNWTTYKYCNYTYNTQIKYCIDSVYGVVDNKTTLEKSDDVAYQTLGDNWRMPTDAEWTELREKCEWTLIEINGVKGYKIEAPNGNSIFLPAAGYRYDDIEDDDSNPENVDSYGYYWSASLSDDRSDSALSVCFASYYIVRWDDSRDSGLSVRPVQDVK